MKNKILLLPILASLSACALPEWTGAGESDPKLPGDRFEVMFSGGSIAADPSMEDETVDIPPAEKTLSNNYGNFFLEKNLENSLNSEANFSARTFDFGDEPDDFYRITSTPIFAGDKIFVIDGRAQISALDKNFNKLWQTQIAPDNNEEQDLAGAISLHNDIIFASTGFGKVAAISVADGKILWQVMLNAPLRVAPVFDADDTQAHIFVASADNKIFALSAQSGEIIWRHSGASEKTRKFAMASPVIKNNMLIATYASGEIFGLDTNFGREIWEDLLSLGLDQTKAAAGLNDISATPLVVDGIVYATNAGNKLAAFNLANGARIWEQAIAGTATPWATERFLFIVNDRNQLVALNRFDGRIKWIAELVETPDDKIVPRWQGPVMAGGHLLVHNNLGEMLVIDASTGSILARKEIPIHIYTTAKIVDGKIYLISNAAEIIELE